jgi:hypothetical protein
MTNKKTLERGESYFGKQDKTLDGMMRDAAVILREPDQDYYGVLYYASRLSQNSENARDVVKQFVFEYLSKRPAKEIVQENIEAIVIGGRYQNNRYVPEGYFVSTPLLTVVADDINNALRFAGITNIPEQKTNPLAVKTARTHKGGIFTLEETVPEDNQHKALMPDSEYELRKIGDPY